MNTRIRLMAFALAFLLSIPSLLAQEMSLDWVYTVGGSQWDQGYDVAIDSEGNIFSCGYFSGAVDFDPSEAEYILTSTANRDMFFQKLDGDGAFLWAVQIEGLEQYSLVENINLSIDTDPAGNLYITGRFDGGIDFDPGEGYHNLYSAGYTDVFIEKLDGDGNFIWAKRFGGLFDDWGNDLIVDEAGNVYSIGAFMVGVDFDPGPNSESEHANWQDAYVHKLDTDGNFVWVRVMEGIWAYTEGEGISIALDASNNVYTTGDFWGVTEFDYVNETQDILSEGETDVYVHKMDSDGNFSWVKTMGSENYERGVSIDVDAAGNVYSIGWFEDPIEILTNSGIVQLTSNGQEDIFIQKMNTYGNLLWVKQMGGVDDDYGASIAVNPSGEIYTTGYFRDTVDFDPGAGEFIMVAQGWSDGFLQKLNTEGDFQGAFQLGGLGFDEGFGLQMDDNGNLFTTGMFTGTTDFNPQSDSLNITTNGSYDVFVQKLVPCNLDEFEMDEVDLPDFVAQCSASPEPPTAYDGCGNAIEGIHLVQFPITEQGSTELLWIYENQQGDVTTQTQTILIEDTEDPYPDVFPLPEIIGRCDITSVQAPAPTATDNCTEVITASANVDFPIPYESVSQIAWTYNDGHGNLVSQNQVIDWQPFDLSTTLDGDTISANNPGAEYQWVDCNNNNASFFGENEQSFTVLFNGNYAVEIAQDGCVGISECVDISALSVNDLGLENNIQVYPNPSNGLFNIAFETILKEAFLTVADSRGSVILTQHVQNTSKAKIEINEASGVYFLTIQTEEGLRTIQLIKE